MAVYATKVVVHQVAIAKRHKAWAQLWADSTPELVDCAIVLGLNPDWIQYDSDGLPYLEVIPKKRQHAIAMGAVKRDRCHTTCSFKSIGLE